MPLGAKHEQAAGAEGDVPGGLDFGFQRSAFLGLRLRCWLDDKTALFGTPLVQAHIDVAAQLNVRAPAGHVGGNGDRARNPGIGDDERFLLVVAGVQHIMRHAGDGLAVALPLVRRQKRRELF